MNEAAQAAEAYKQKEDDPDVHERTGYDGAGRPARDRTATPAETLLARLGLATKATAEVQDLYSRPIATTPVIPLVTRSIGATADAA